MFPLFYLFWACRFVPPMISRLTSRSCEACEIVDDTSLLQGKAHEQGVYRAFRTVSVMPLANRLNTDDADVHQKKQKTTVSWGEPNLIQQLGALPFH